MNRMTVRGLAALSLCLVGTRAAALPVELKDQNGTSYFINTQVSPLPDTSNASGAVTNATYFKPVTVTSYYVGVSFFGFYTYTVQRQVNVPLRNAFAGFNGLVISAVNGQTLSPARVFNPMEALAAEDCLQNNINRQLSFATQTFSDLNLQVTRKVFVPHNAAFTRWLNIVTNTGTAPAPVAISLRGLLGSENETKVVATSTGDSSITAADLWFTTAQSVPQNTPSDEPRLGFVVQGAGAPTPPTSVGVNSLGQAVFTYTPTIPAGGTAIIMTFATVQGSSKEAMKTVENVVGLPANAVTCLSEQELQQVVNFSPITPPQTKNATIAVNFTKTGDDTVQWKGKVTIGAGVSLQGLPVTVDVGGATASFPLNKSGAANDGGGNKFTLSAKLSQGVTKAGTVNFSFNLKGDFKGMWADYGLTDASVQNVPVTVPVSFTAGPGSYATTQAFTYKATQGKSGKAKSS